MYRTLISTTDLAELSTDPQCAIIDCRFELSDPILGKRLYLEAHIPGAVYADLDIDLSGPPDGTNGRHPLPPLDMFQSRLSQWGIDRDTQVVAYDQDVGMFASRLWWMLRYLGHQAVAALDGGFAKWVREGRSVGSGVETRPPRSFDAKLRREMTVTIDEVDDMRKQSDYLLIDARAPDRFRGENETIDPVAGHIPGAVNRHYQNNVNTVKGTFLEPDEIRIAYESISKGRTAKNIVCYCGSGVSACHNLLAMEHAGLTGAKLYPGSWSEWCAHPNLPIET